MSRFYISICLIPDLDDQLSSRLSARKVGLGLLHARSSEGVLMEDVDFHDALAHDIEEERRVLSALLGGGHVVRHGRTEKFDILLCELEERDWRNRAGSISEGNERSFPLQDLEVIVEPVHGDQYTVYRTNSG